MGLSSSGGCSGLPGAVSAALGVVLVVGVVLSEGRAGSERRRCSGDWRGLSLQPGRSWAWLTCCHLPAPSRREGSLRRLPRVTAGLPVWLRWAPCLLPSSAAQASLVPWASPTLCGSFVLPASPGCAWFPPEELQTGLASGAGLLGWRTGSSLLPQCSEHPSSPTAHTPALPSLSLAAQVQALA